MKNVFTLLLLIASLHSISQNASVGGYWYGNANVKSNNSTNNYLVELIISENKTQVKGVINYYFKNTFRSLAVNGNYNSMTRQLILFNIPVTYHGSLSSMEVDCMMNLAAKLRVSKEDARLVGFFQGKSEYRYTCADINFSLKKEADASKKDSILNAIRHYKEEYQVWRPTAIDTLAPVTVIQRKVVNYVVEDQFKQRQNEVVQEIDVNSDSIQVDFYDNGEVDGDSISVFFNKQLLAFNRKISTRSIHFDLVLDNTKEENELSMFADNLGAIPPNTALMVVYDGKKRYEVRLSSNLEKNATIRFKRKK
ncbi:MAG: hypothetical protein JNL23_04780 [Chitinophagaceae bacterium]|nr:hypothetical protein [Chitinophagaceae bacterium]